jgi:heterodisulfide reductase subunit A
MVLGAGVAGICTALELAKLHIRVELVEKSAQLGGHAARLSCKATDRCVQCGACLVYQRICQAVDHPLISIHRSTIVKQVEITDRFKVTLMGLSDSPGLSAAPNGLEVPADALVLATGFDLFNPDVKPYGYGHLADVVTNLELETRLRSRHGLWRPSDGRAPGRVAFIQCVGSRDHRLGRAWCSRFCCAAALRSAAWIQKHQPQTQISFFYIDNQTYDPLRDSMLAKISDAIGMIRSVPADILAGPDDRLRITYWDSQQRCSTHTDVDMAVLSAGMQPSAGTAAVVSLLGAAMPDWQSGDGDAGSNLPAGVFMAGSAAGPRTIAETVASAGAAAWQVARYLGITI